MIRDPQFWNRFSIAVHQDELEKQLMTAQDPKHSYVLSTSSFSFPTTNTNTTTTTTHSPRGPPTAQIIHHPSSPSYPPMAQLPSLRSSLLSSPLSPTFPDTTTSVPGTPTAPKAQPQEKKKSKKHLHKSSSTKLLIHPITLVSDAPPPPPSTSSTSKPHPLSPLSPPAPHGKIQRTSTTTTFPSSPSRPFFRAPNISTFSLSLSGRPASRFRFVTTITADASHRDSWLVRQKKKERHRAWLCWAFWGVFLLLVAGIVVTILVLKSRKIL